MANRTMSPAAMEMVAQRFKALSEPARLFILSELRGGELCVNEIVGRTEMSQAAVSKHLRILHERGFVARRREGVFVMYALADEDVLALCDLVCGRVERELDASERAFAAHDA